MNQQNIHWFPGHMKKAWRQIEEKLPLIDLLIEVRDARAPDATELPAFPLKARQTHLILFNKEDLADPKKIQPYVQRIKTHHDHVLAVSLTDKQGWKQLLQELTSIEAIYHERDRLKGKKPQVVKVMIVGVPNVGKSTLINALIGQRRVATENRAGSTRGQQWVHGDKGFSLLDTPGVLTPRYETQTMAMHLACIGSMKFSILPQEELGRFLFTYFSTHYPHLIHVDSSVSMNDYHAFLVALATRRHMLMNGEVDVARAETSFLHDVANGVWGRFSLVHEKSSSSL